MKYEFQLCSYKNVEDETIAYYSALTSPIESFIESHILKSKHYHIVFSKKTLEEVGMISNTRYLRIFF